MRALPVLVALAASAVLIGILTPLFGMATAALAVAVLCLLAAPVELAMLRLPPSELRFTPIGVLVRRPAKYDVPVPWEVVREVRRARWLGLSVVVLRVESSESDRIILIPLGNGIDVEVVLTAVRRLAPAVPVN